MPVHPDGESSYGAYSTLFFDFPALQVVVVTQYYASCAFGNKNQRTLNPI